MEVNPLSQLYSDFIKIIKTSVIKYKVEADKYETLDMKKSADEYIRAVLKEDTFNTYHKYNKDVINEVMGSSLSDSEIAMYQLDRNLIPYEKRDQMLTKQRDYVVNNYVEKNNYYRCVNGLPDYEDTEFIYVDPKICEDYAINDIDPDTNERIPIHKLGDYYITELEEIGYIKELIDKNPEKKYLNFLGTNRVDLVEARKTRNFGLLRQPTGISESLTNNFSLIYEQCREYFMVCIYIVEYRSTIDYYDNFIAMCIMIMTMQQIMARIVKNTIERDFYDNYCCKLLFETYGVPYNANMDSATRTQLIQNLNMLVRNKGTNKVIYDIASILGYDRLQIYKYYLIKSQKFDVNGLPIKSDKDGIEGKKEEFDIYFQKAAIDNDDAYDAIINASDTIGYEEMTGPDPYWWHDEDVEKLLYESEYNYVESKYMGVGISYRMTRVIFENVYLIKLILDKKDKINDIMLDLPKISTGITLSLFDTVILMCALLCKQNNLKGEVLIDMSKVLHVLNFTHKDFNIISDNINSENLAEDYRFYDGNVMGFNCDVNAKEIQDKIKSDPYLDNDLCKFFTNSSSYTVDGINKLYKDYKLLYSELVEKMSTTNNKDVYDAYKKLYKGFFYTKENREIFNMGTVKNPKYPETYMDYIKSTHPEIYDYIKDLDQANTHALCTHIIAKLNGALEDLHTLGFFNGNSSIMETMLLDLIRFFKSYTTDLINMDIIYIYDLKPENMIRFIDHIKTTKSEIIIRDNINISYSDYIYATSKIEKNEDLKFMDKMVHLESLINLFDNQKFMDIIHTINSKTIISDHSIGYMDIMDYIISQISISEGLRFRDEVIVNVFNKYGKQISKYVIKERNDFIEYEKTEYGADTGEP